MLGLFPVLFLGIVLCAGLQVKAFQAASLYLEDALAASNLASAVIDVREYGISRKVLISDPMGAYALYCEALEGNLRLNQRWEGDNRDLISGEITVESFIIYNVDGESVEVFALDNGGNMSTWQGALGAVRAPNDLLIEHTSVYSEISFPVEGNFGVAVQARKGKLVDIVGQGEILEELEEEAEFAEGEVKDETANESGGGNPAEATD